MSEQTTQTSSFRPKLALPGAKLKLGGFSNHEENEQQTGAGNEIRILGEGDEGGEEGMIHLVGGDDVDLNASYEISAAGTLRTAGFVLKSSGIQSQPERRGSHQQPQANHITHQPHAATSSASSASSSAAVSPGSPDGSSLPVFNPADLIDLGSVGKGACGVVKRAVHLPSLRILALKQINIFDKDKRHQFVKELSALGSINSPYIVGFAGAFFSEGAVTILLEYSNRHSLLEMLKIHGAFPEILLQRIALHSFRGLEILHQARCIHRDIKPGNILINSKAECKLTDFGVVTALEGTMDLASTFVGTTIFMSV